MAASESPAHGSRAASVALVGGGLVVAGAALQVAATLLTGWRALPSVLEAIGPATLLGGLSAGWGLRRLRERRHREGPADSAADGGARR